MVTKTILMIQMLALAVLSLLFTPSSTSSSINLRFHLTRVDAKLNLTKYELHRRAILRTKLRVASLASNMASASVAAVNVQSTVHLDSGEFLMDMAVGKPLVTISVVADTGSDLVWIQCNPSAQCSNQPIYNPSCSNTFHELTCDQTECNSTVYQCNTQDNSCHYDYGYGDGSSTKGVLSRETFTFGSDHDTVSVPGIVFGCSSLSQGNGMDIAGLAGLGYRGMSLVSQLGVSKFSYCLTSYDDPSETSPILFGSAAVLDGGSTAVQSTPILFSSDPNKPYYFLRLQAITVGISSIPVTGASAVSQSGDDSFIIDSGTSITILESGLYEQFVQALQEQMNMQLRYGSGDEFASFLLPSSSIAAEAMSNVPKLVFHFDGADMDLTQSYLYHEPGTNTLQVKIMGTSNLPSILGNYQQQNMHILYDIDNGMLSFVPAQCDQL